MKTVLDIGANVGFAALYFLTRSPGVKVYCFEPDEVNARQLRINLSGFENRYDLSEVAVTIKLVDELRFIPAGRYGHETTDCNAGIAVPAINVQNVLDITLAESPEISLIKIDTEGTELELVEEFKRSKHADRIKSIVYEDNSGATCWLVPSP